MKRSDLPDNAASKHQGGPPRAAKVALPLLSPAGRVEANPPTVGFVSLGCAKNLVDSEMMLGQLAESGCVISGDESVADTIVVNTCGFLESSRDEALGVLRELAARKNAGTLKRIVVAGCLVQRDGEKLIEWVPEIDALVGVNNRDDVVRAVRRMDAAATGAHATATGAATAATRSRTGRRADPIDRFMGDYHPAAADTPLRWNDRGRLRLTPQHYAYVRISEGCNQKCTFCTIPSIRGPMHSKTPAELVAECRELIDDGAKELILIGQDTTSYGLDLTSGVATFSDSHVAALPPSQAVPGLANLLRTLDRDCDGAKWIRLMYVYPSVLSDEMLDAIAESDRVVKYIDIPLQHINDRMLKAMHRRVTRRETEALLERIRRRIPGVSIRTTFIVGFPGETEAEFRELLEFTQQAGFDAAGAFQYSLEPDTPAGRIKGQLDPAEKADRHERFMLVQQEVALAAARRQIGSSFEVLIDGETPGALDARGTVARHAGQAPDVDSVCILPDGDFEPGEFTTVKCIETDDYDLVVRPARRKLRLAR